MIGTLLATGLIIQSAGGPLPVASSLGELAIAKADSRDSWPFVARSGKLVCMPRIPRPAVFFYPDEGPATKNGILLDFNPYGLMLNNWTTGKPLLPYSSPEELNKRIAPFIAQGLELCRNNDSPVVPGAEL
jgi:hypothetical protein